jgi:hypothetical protein
MKNYRGRVATSCGKTNGDMEKLRIQRQLDSRDMPSVQTVDDELVRSLRIQCAKYGVTFDEKIRRCTDSEYWDCFNTLTKMVAAKKQLEISGEKSFLAFNESVYNGLSENDKKHYIICHEHEAAMFDLIHTKCCKCMCVSMVKAYTKNRRSSSESNFTCSDCMGKKDDYFHKEGNNKLLPVWFDDDHNVHYEQPNELKILRLGEQLLIQRFSVFVPVVHIRNGIMGLKGHCCCFSQDVSEVANSLPRKNVEVVVVTKGTVDKNGNEFQKNFQVRRTVVLDALKWLKKHHKWYREDPDLVIDEDNLNWMHGQEEAELTGIHYVEENEQNASFSNGVVCGANDDRFIEGDSGKSQVNNIENFVNEFNNCTFHITRSTELCWHNTTVVAWSGNGRMFKHFK